ncbi:hypothetical protein IQ276_029775 [Desmonostoc muscorum LEGE 12446]|uniref:hypothetical protein n=1 Tax=Desmonostoc muscorum TaxID=1179 RepID=UPI001F278274|nr:hypothetical protein [Desmonostoc muscorum]MCF2150541.1 hypothetical protein [Desmonostoc muscorum LEGE 12446]
MTLVIFRTLKVCDRRENTNICLAIIKKVVQIPGGKIAENLQISRHSTFLFA